MVDDAVYYRSPQLPEENIWYQYNSDYPSYNIRTQRGVKRQCILTYYIIYNKGSMLRARTCLSEQPLLTNIFPCVDSIRFILSALNSAHDSPPESTHLSPTSAMVNCRFTHLSVFGCCNLQYAIVLLVHDGGACMCSSSFAFRRGKKNENIH